MFNTDLFLLKHTGRTCKCSNPLKDRVFLSWAQLWAQPKKVTENSVGSKGVGVIVFISPIE